MIFRLMFLILAVYRVFPVSANNLQISDLQIDGAGEISFRVSWENAWNLSNLQPNNNDGAWIFIKMKEMDGAWETLPSADFTLFTIEGNQLTAKFSAQNEVGFLLIPTNDGNFSYISDKISFKLNNLPSEFALKVMGVEMVYVPESPFYLGDAVSVNSFMHENDSFPIQIETEDALVLSVLGKSEIKYALTSTYPKAYQSFYAMKYEISQEQYADFLNCLSFEQQYFRTILSPASDINTRAMSYSYEERNGIVVSVSGENPNRPAVYECNGNADLLFSGTDDAQNRAANYLNWADLAAYLDWSGLRPLSELEYEKLCRGTLLPLPGELAWGTVFAEEVEFLLFDGSPDESATNLASDSAALAHFGYSNIKGPVRAGFAALPERSRVKSGASYYGAFELSGNVWEILVSASYGSFKATNGNGTISASGFADVDDWPLENASGTIYRGGAWNSGLYEIGSYRDMAVSDRFYIDLPANMRRNTTGGRGGLSW